MMGLMKIIRRIVFPHSYSGEAYINYLRSRHVIIGEHVKIWSPNHTYIDETKPYLIKIGNYVKITQGVSILAHDYSRSVLRRQFGEFRGGTLPVSIGDNVFIGYNATILMGTTIGNNCIIGAHAVVKGEFPDGSVIAGNPAQVVCSTNDMWEKASSRWIEDAKRVARTIYVNKGNVLPAIEEMSDAYVWLYLPRTQENVDRFRVFFDLSGDDFEEVKKKFMNSKPYYDSFDSFLADCGFKEFL